MDVVKLKEKMYGAGFSQRKLAKATGCCVNTISAICTGKRCPRVDEAKLICETLSIDSNDERAQIFLR